MRAGIYSRFSTDLQDRKSCEDQEADARRYAARRGYQVISCYRDEGKSGTLPPSARPGLQHCLDAARRGELDVIVVEHTDRLSRAPEHLHPIHAELRFRSIGLDSVSTGGPVSDIQVHVEAMVSQMHLKAQSDKTRRGMRGVAREGRSAGGVVYGYDVVPGEKRGVRIINEREAAIVLRIFREVASRRSALAVVGDLNRDGIPGPRGGQWNVSTLIGSASKDTGMLRQTLYIGEQRFGKRKSVRDPATGKKLSRPADPANRIDTAVPHLRIVDQELWDAVQAERRTYNQLPLARRARPKHMLSGIIRCGICGGNYIMRSRNYLACTNAYNKSSCTNRRSITVDEVEDRTLRAVQKFLFAPDIVAAAIEGYRERTKERARERNSNRSRLERELGEVQRSINRMVKSIKEGVDAKLIAPDLNSAGDRKAAIEAELRRVPKNDPAVLHPNAAESYRMKVADIHAALKRGDAASREAISLIRELVQEIVVRPDTTPLGLDVVGDLAALLHREQSGNSSTTPVVAGVGFEPTTFRL